MVSNNSSEYFYRVAKINPDTEEMKYWYPSKWVDSAAKAKAYNSIGHAKQGASHARYTLNYDPLEYKHLVALVCYETKEYCVQVYDGKKDQYIPDHVLARRQG